MAENNTNNQQGQYQEGSQNQYQAENPFLPHDLVSSFYEVKLFSHHSSLITLRSGTLLYIHIERITAVISSPIIND